MNTKLNECQRKPPRAPWNKGNIIGPKPPLRTKNVWSIQIILQVDGRTDLAMFNVTIDSMRRGCDVVSLKVEDLVPNGMAIAINGTQGAT